MTSSQRARFIPYHVGKSKCYIDKVTNKQITESEFQKIITANYDHDKQQGYIDRMAGFYDKWYRYRRLDDGAAYDEGVKLASQDKGCPDEMQIIPCIV